MQNLEFEVHLISMYFQTLYMSHMIPVKAVAGGPELSPSHGWRKVHHLRQRRVRTLADHAINTPQHQQLNDWKLKG